MVQVLKNPIGLTVTLRDKFLQKLFICRLYFMFVIAAPLRVPKCGLFDISICEHPEVCGSPDQAAPYHILGL
jgi:hypothetical protein